MFPFHISVKGQTLLDVLDVRWTRCPSTEWIVSCRFLDHDNMYQLRRFVDIVRRVNNVALAVVAAHSRWLPKHVL